MQLGAFISAYNNMLESGTCFTTFAFSEFGREFRSQKPVSHVEKPPVMLYQRWHSIMGTHDIFANFGKIS